MRIFILNKRESTGHLGKYRVDMTLSHAEKRDRDNKGKGNQVQQARGEKEQISESFMES